MSFGVTVVTNSGKVIDTSTIPVTLLDIISVPAGGSGTKVYPELDGLNITLGTAVQKTFNSTAQNISAYATTVGSSYAVTWGPSGTGGSQSGALVIVFVR